MNRIHDITDRQIKKLRKKYYGTMGDYLFNQVLEQCFAGDYNYECAKRKFKNTEVVYASEFIDAMESEPIGNNEVHKAKRDELHKLADELKQKNEDTASMLIKNMGGSIRTFDDLFVLDEETDRYERELGELISKKAFAAYENLLTLFVDSSDGTIAFTRCKAAK